MALLLCVVLLFSAARITDADVWLKNQLSYSDVYEDEFVDPLSVGITFPAVKRNLIYIYLESMENTFFSQDLGGALPYNVLPDLHRLAQENINFSHDAGVGGCPQIAGATWTIAAIVAHSSGIPLCTPPGVGENDYGTDGGLFLPGVTTIYDILHANGYHQAFMCGSDAKFGGRSQFFTQHGVDDILDLYTAQRSGQIPAEYSDGWWGMEDQKLYEYAKTELLDLAATGQPFSFTLLTVDTHHIGGNFRECCPQVYGEQYENVYACADAQIFSFIQWLIQQDFYADTTIVITGDHCSMDGEYIQKVQPDGYTRRIYNCFINAAAEPALTKFRSFTQFDMFPSTLAAMGCSIDGRRLGLGTDLFSPVATLAERYDFDTLNLSVTQKSEMYNTVFLQLKEAAEG